MDRQHIAPLVLYWICLPPTLKFLLYRYVFYLMTPGCYLTIARCCALLACRRLSQHLLFATRPGRLPGPIGMLTARRSRSRRTVLVFVCLRTSTPCLRRWVGTRLSILSPRLSVL